MSGYYRLQRGWQDNPLFGNDEYSERDAWVWLIESAAWRPSRARVKGTLIDLARGQLCFSQRFMAEKWGWSKSRVDRFLKRLAGAEMISTCSKIGATAGHPAGQGQSVITICNYEKYQGPTETERGNGQNDNGATAGQQRGKEERREEGKKEIEVTAGAASDYAFEGRIIRLKHVDLDRWRTSFPDVDVQAQLQSRDDWLATEADEATRKKWFVSTSNQLASLQSKARQRAREPAWESPC